MGDRSNIFIQHNEQEQKFNGEIPLPRQWSGIGLYSHWGGLDMHDVAITAAKDSEHRLGDPSYFTRRVMHLILNVVDPECAETGHGLWCDVMDDNEYPILVINANTGMCWYVDRGGDYRADAPSDGDAVDVREGLLPVLPAAYLAEYGDEE